MSDYKYATKKIKKPYKDKIISLLNKVRKDLKGKLKFEHKFVGSEALGLVTYDPFTNTGFDFDIDILPSKAHKYKPKELKTMLIASFNKFCKQFNFDYPEDSSSVFTIKVKDHANSKIIFSVDFAIVDVFLDKEGNLHERKVYFDKKTNTYCRREQPKEAYEHLSKIKSIKDAGNGYREQLKILYLHKKNTNTDRNKSSSALRKEAVNEIYSKL